MNDRHRLCKKINRFAIHVTVKTMPSNLTLVNDVNDVQGPHHMKAVSLNKQQIFDFNFPVLL